MMKIIDIKLSRASELLKEMTVIFIVNPFYILLRLKKVAPI